MNMEPFIKIETGNKNNAQNPYSLYRHHSHLMSFNGEESSCTDCYNESKIGITEFVEVKVEPCGTEDFQPNPTEKLHVQSQEKIDLLININKHENLSDFDYLPGTDYKIPSSTQCEEYFNIDYALTNCEVKFEDPNPSRTDYVALLAANNQLCGGGPSLNAAKECHGDEPVGQNMVLGELALSLANAEHRCKQDKGFNNNNVKQENDDVECQFSKSQITKRKREKSDTKQNKKCNSIKDTSASQLDKKYKCEKCNYSSKYKAALKRHSPIHENQRKNSTNRSGGTLDLAHRPCSNLLHCSFCGKVFTLKVHLDSHLLNIHRNEINNLDEVITHKINYCQFCDYQTIWLTSLANHMACHHRTSNTPKYICYKCHFETYRRSHLVQHLRIHSPVKLYTCCVCKKGFNQKVHYDSHLVCYHKKEIRDLDKILTNKVQPGTFTCDKCQRDFPFKSNLVRHLKTHLNVKSFTCTSCNRGFRRKDELDSHILSKHGDNEALVGTISNKIHDCSGCSYRTTSLSSLKLHCKRPSHEMKDT